MARKSLGILIVAAAAALMAMPASAQTTNLNGTWKLNVSKSNFGQFPPPTSETDVIEINGTDFKQHVTSVTQRGNAKYTRACTINGRETQLTPDSPNAHIGAVLLDKITCAWDGSSLVVTEGAKMQGNDSELTDKLTFSSSDRKTMKLTSHITSPTINADRTMIYDKSEDSGTAANGGVADTAGSEALIHTGGGDHPNLSGTWKLDVPKSNFGQAPGPASEVDTIADNEPSLKVSIAQKGGMMGDVNMTEAMTTDGQPSSWKGMADADVSGTAHWDGSTLVVNAKSSFQGSDVTMKETYSLSSDGNTLTHTMHAETTMGNFDSTSVFDKQ